jgi:hypothetical protein
LSNNVLINYSLYPKINFLIRFTQLILGCRKYSFVADLSVIGTYTTREQALRSEDKTVLVSIALRTETNVSFSPGSSGEGTHGASLSFSLGSVYTFSPGWRYQPGLEGLRSATPHHEPL